MDDLCWISLLCFVACTFMVILTHVVKDYLWRNFFIIMGILLGIVTTIYATLLINFV